MWCAYMMLCHTRTVLIDYKKAFDHLDQNIIIQKLTTMGVPRILVEWTTSFLHERQQRVKIRRDVTSDWVYVNGGVPQGTKLGPLLFLVMINDLEPSGVDVIKFSDDTTFVEKVKIERGQKCQQL